MTSQNNTLNIIIFANTNLEIVEPLFKQGVNIVGVIESEDRTTINNPIKRRIVKFNRLLKGMPSYTSLREFAKTKDIPYLEYKKTDKEQVVEWIKALGVDLLLSHQAPILPEEVFLAPKFGSINIHPTLLPKYRGSNPFFWMFYDEDMVCGITLHWIDSGIDTGKIIEQRSLQIQYGTDADQLERRLVAELAIPAVLKFLNQFEENSKTEEQPEQSPTPYAGRVTDEKYRSMLMNKSVSIRRFWHVLHANQQWHTALLPKKPDPAFHWVLSHYKEKEQADLHGEVEYKAKSINIHHANGTVVISRKFNLNRYIAHRLLGWLK
ncbi:methionyl-tRNA formyltransferase [Pleionea mediterranea]|uniref:Formyl transferase-like protein n=1 Tax=Pleionea mediterranea TaxID=523701 RepID=A0A316FZ84_9GAMM|nr:formyltransferase family protein [Pleionea mediterranea]PWK53702.1 formyl transferase-like protein [Pleionea mediterranea]